MAPSKKRKAPPNPPFSVVVFTCPDKTCLQCFKTERGLASHFDKSPTCARGHVKLIPLVQPNNTAKTDPTDNNQSHNELPQSLQLAPTELSDTSLHSEESSDSGSVLEDSDEEPEIHSMESSEGEDIDGESIDHGTTGSMSCASYINDFTCIDNGMFLQTKLMKILHDANAPHFLFQQIIEWLQEVVQSKVNVADLIRTRTGVIHQLEKTFPFLKENCPYQIKTALPTSTNPQFVDVTVFDFKKQLLSLIDDPSLFGDIGNLDVNKDNVFGKYRATDKLLSTVNSGHRYKYAYQSMIQDKESEFLMPIVFACDETKVSSQGKASCWPLMFSTTILNQTCRNRPTAWRPLGYVYDTSLLLSANEEKRLGVTIKYTRLHRILDSILASYVHCQKGNSLDGITLRFGSVSKKMNLKVPCFFIIGDMQGGDKMCCSAPVYLESVNRLCRKCNVKGKDSGDPFVECKNIVMKRIQDLVTKNQIDELKKLNQYHVHNAWFKVDFGGCPFGIFSAACPVEPLHALENGIIADCLKVLFSKIGSTASLAKLDDLARQLTKLPRQQSASSGSDKSMPRLLWKDGITTLTDLTASCKVGIMFTIVVISLLDTGKQFFTEVFGQTKILNDMRECFQMLLCYWMWLKKETYWVRNDYASMNQAKQAIQQMLSRIITLWPRQTGQGWNLAKFHEQLHVPDDIYNNGSPRGSHSGPLEHNHIQMVKRPSQRTQKRRSNLDHQLAQRLYENVLVNSAMEQMSTCFAIQSLPANPRSEILEIHPNSSKGSLRIHVTPEHRSAYYSSGKMKLSHAALAYITDSYITEINPDVTGDVTFDYYSEIRKDGNIYRAHSNYRQNGPWMDWVMIRWDHDENVPWSISEAKECSIHYGDSCDNPDDFLYSPAKILCFTSPESKTIHAIIECCDFKFKRGSIISTEWKKAFIYHGQNHKTPYICFVDAEAIVRHCLVVPDTKDGTDIYHEVWNRDLWGAEFI